MNIKVDIRYIIIESVNLIGEYLKKENKIEKMCLLNMSGFIRLKFYYVIWLLFCKIFVSIRVIGVCG